MTKMEEASSAPSGSVQWPREDLTLFLTAVLCLCLSIYFFVARLWPRSRRAALGFGESTKRVLLVTAHPDDEVMFFGPTLAALCRSNNEKKDGDAVEVMLLCLSYGDYRGGGMERKRELYESCRELGVPEENITVLRYTRLRDDPAARWREELVSEVVLRAVVSAQVDTVVTFDRGGVSGHRNHIAVHNAMALLCLERR